jgi:hypothetical protein
VQHSGIHDNLENMFLQADPRQRVRCSSGELLAGCKQRNCKCAWRCTWGIAFTAVAWLWICGVSGAAKRKDCQVETASLGISLPGEKHVHRVGRCGGQRSPTAASVPSRYGQMLAWLQVWVVQQGWQHRPPA